MRRHVNASSAETIQRRSTGRGVSREVGLIALGAITSFFLLLATQSASAATCPNVVFRTGPSAKLPDCRAYELVTPTDTGGLPPSSTDFIDAEGLFAWSPVTDAGNDVIFNTNGGSLGSGPGSGVNDRYRSRRTSSGWVSQFDGVSGSLTERAIYGGSSPDHNYYILEAGNPYFPNQLAGTYLHTPGGFEPLAKGTLGEFPGVAGSRKTWAHLITPTASHVIFQAPNKLEPDAPGEEIQTIYDRTPGGPTKVVSLLPGDVTPTKASKYIGASADGTVVAFENERSWFVRTNNTMTREVARPSGAIVGKQLECTGEPQSATLAYQWLRNGNPIGGATSSTYTTTVADEGGVLQCQVTASVAGEGSSVATSSVTIVVPNGKNPPEPQFSTNISGGISTAGIGQTLNCASGTWGGNPAPTLSYQWLRNGTAIPAATDSAYTAVGADNGTALQCKVTGTNADGTAVIYSSNSVVVQGQPTATANPTIANTTDPGAAPEVGDQLSCAEGTWTQSPSFAFQWLRGGSPIATATASTYTVAAADEEQVLQCQVTGSNADGATEAVSAEVTTEPQPATSPPELTFTGGIFGTAKVGGELFCESGSWEGEPSFTFQWLRNGTEIPGATANGYTLVAEDDDDVIQCRVTATNAGGSAVAINANQGALLVGTSPPAASANLPATGHTFGGVFGGQVFYSDSSTGEAAVEVPGDLYSYDIATGTTTAITHNLGDASFVNVADSGARAYFVAESAIGGEGVAGEPNLYVWTRSGDSTKFIATLDKNDVTNPGRDGQSGLTTWHMALWPEPTLAQGGRVLSHTRSTPDGSVLVFEATSQLTSFDNTEASPEDCGDEATGVREGCDEVYRYDAGSGELSCVSCGGPNSGAQIGSAQLQSTHTRVLETQLLDPSTVINNLSEDGDTVFFETKEGLLPQDENGREDAYRWKQGEGLALISTGQDLTDSHLYAATPSSKDVIFATKQKLLPQDENGTTTRLYDARVGGGFPPPESTVTEPCSGDVCQGAASPEPASPQPITSSVSGAGNVVERARCPKGRRAVKKHGKQSCVKQKKHAKKKRRAGSKRGAAR